MTTIPAAVTPNSNLPATTTVVNDDSSTSVSAFGGLLASEYADIVKYLKGGEAAAWFDAPHTWKFRHFERGFSLDDQGLLLRKGLYVLQDWESEAVLKKLHIDLGHMKTNLLRMLTRGTFAYARTTTCDFDRDVVRSVTSCHLCHGARFTMTKLSMFTTIREFRKLRCLVKPSECGRGIKVLSEGVDALEVRRHHEDLVRSAEMVPAYPARRKRGRGRPLIISASPSKKQTPPPATTSVIYRPLPSDSNRTTPASGGPLGSSPVSTPVTAPVTLPVQQIAENTPNMAATAMEQPSTLTLKRIKTEPSAMKSEEPIRSPSIDHGDLPFSYNNWKNTPNVEPESRSTNREEEKTLESTPTTKVPPEKIERAQPVPFFVCTPSGNIKCPEGFVPSQPSHKITKKITKDGKGQLLIRAFMVRRSGDNSTENMEPEQLFDGNQSFISTEYGQVYIPDGYKCTNCGISENAEDDALEIEIRLQLQKLK